MACPRRHMDSLRLAAAAGARYRVDPASRTQYLRLRARRTPAAASRAESIRAGGEFTAHYLHPRPRELWISQTLYREIGHRRSALQRCLLDQSRPGFLSLAGG